MAEQLDVVIVGGGQGGLAVSHELTQADVPHVVLEKGRIGQTWRGWWDSFCLVAPQLDRPAARAPLRRERSGRLHGP